MRNAYETYQEVRNVGYQFEIRSDADHALGEEFAWGDLLLRTVAKRHNENYQVVRVPSDVDERVFYAPWADIWRFVYMFEVVGLDPPRSLPRGWL